MMMVMISSIMASAMALVMMTLCYVTSKSSSQDREKMSPFECGFNPKKSARTPFSIQFFLLAVLFLIFDIEIAIILPIIITMKMAMTSKWILTVTLFITLLILGLYHEWKNGMLEWAK
uniref:NADH dehydrogenase subunit 3 n=1 Tax=Megacopta caliginosa TaxID=2968962 RepID=UPI00223745B2|nr:NADH dehydrogenase subunit 3 [Megacopta caliginosa]UYA97674.1 NADH dehydrogenase subunit 3 [Megacopta caliginosa]UYA97687.1 NADH dehydrogenase subunit 3 [Megacopta caliginosa]